MDWTSGQYIQLIIALMGGITLFAAAYTMPQRWIIWTLVLLVPFQLIQSRYGSINMVLTYMVFVAFFARGSIKRLPMLGTVLAIMFVYILSLSQVIRPTFFQHVVHLISVFSNFLLFYLVYNYVRDSGDTRDMWRLLAAVNVLVIFYCLLEMAAGAAGIQIFGLEELEVRSQKANDGHLTGPFRAIAMTAEYLAIQSVIALYALIHEKHKRKRLFWMGLMAVNLGLLIATASRGGVISLVVALLVFSFMYRTQIGIRKLVIWLGSGAILFSASSFFIVNYTSYNIMFERLEGTEIKGGLPDTRQGWRYLWPKIIEKPIIGHGPRMKFNNEELIRHPQFVPMMYPHSAYLFLIYTIGFVGLFVYLWFFARLALQYLSSGKNQSEDPFVRGLPYLGFVLLFLFAVSEIRMEMFRYILHAYQQYFFMLMGAFLAFSHIARKGGGVPVSVAEPDDDPAARPGRILRYKDGEA